jgi:hypothetical protein
MPAGARPNAPVPERDDATDAFIHEPDPGNEIALLQTISISGKAACRQVKDLGQRKKNGLEDLSFHYSIQRKAVLCKRGDHGMTGRFPERASKPAERAHARLDVVDERWNLSIGALTNSIH